MEPSDRLRIGYVPEHFSTPLHFACKHFSLDATLIPFPSGTGHMIVSLQSKEIDVAMGLTEGFIAFLANNGDAAGFKLVGTYVETPLCWAISTGADRDLNSVKDLRGKNMGCSRIGSGSYVMAYVLAETQNWLEVKEPPPFTAIPCQTFAKLREGVNSGDIDYFLWEYFTSKRYYDNGDIKKIGQIDSPWSSWKIVATDSTDKRLESLFEKLDQGVQYFLDHPDEAVAYISTELDYSEEDAREWLKTVRFEESVKGVRKETVEKTIAVLKKAHVIDEKSEIGHLIGVSTG